MSAWNQKHHKKKRSFNQFNSKNTNTNYNNNNRSPSPNKKRKYTHNTDANASNHSSQNKNIKYGPDYGSDTNNNSNNKHNPITNDDSLENILSNIKRNKPRKWTVSVAIAGSVMTTAKTPQLQTYLAGQFARIISIFAIDEIIVFSETGSVRKEEPFKPDPNLFFYRLLQYLETPQYLRRLLFPVHKDFRYIGMCRPLRTPHHLGRNELSPYREGIVLKKTVINPKQSNKKHKKHKNKNKKLPKVIANMQANETNDENKVSLVSIGLNKLCVIDKKLDENMRVTVKLKDWENANSDEEYWYGKAIKPTYPMKKDGIYWGYKTRFAHDIGEVLSECIYDDGYDVIIGTSDKGSNVYDNGFKIEQFKHLLIVFGGPNGLESCVLNKGENGEMMKLDKPQLLFDKYINVCPYQATRTIRSEEAVLMTLSVLQPHLQNNYD